MGRKIKSGIYKILNLTTNKFYIGSAINLKKRCEKHINELIKNIHKNPYLQNAWNKQWGQNFEFIVLELVEDKNDLLVREQWWMDFTQSYNSEIGYNICRIAGSMLGTKQTKEHIEKRIKSRKVFKHTEATKEKIRQSLKGYKHDEEFSLKLSKAKRGKQYRLGTKTSDETKAKLSIAGKGRKHTAEAKEKVAASKRGVPRTEEVKAKLRLAALKQWEIKKAKANSWIN